MSDNEDNCAQSVAIDPLPHHSRHQICTTRPKYRDGRRETAVKVFTINDESRYLLLHRVPALKLRDEVIKLCRKYGPLEYVKVAKDYPNVEPFTEVFVVKYKFLENAIYAKKRLDDLSFMGEVLHVCYAPELEAVDETRLKLSGRETNVKLKIKRLQSKASKKAKFTEEETD